MDRFALLDMALGELRGAVAALDESQMGLVTNCDPWTVRQLASHAVNTQLFWVGVVTGTETVSFEDTMEAVAYDGDLLPILHQAAARARSAWSRPGVLDAIHTTPSNQRPGSDLICFPIIDALAHSWDLAVSTGRSLEFASATVPGIEEVIEQTKAMGLFAVPDEPPPDASETERLMAATGRSIPR